ncbi:MAG TPA: o-succinylbenzoate synthase [Terriglobales bacterium]|nr:o-succinylbenzoate synthase [Terriglobales bacterium]
MRTAATPTRTMPQVPIRLVSVEVLALDLPMITSFKTAHGTTTRKRTIIVRAEDADGVVGWGESPASDLPLYSPDTYESVWYALTRLLVPLVVGRSFRGPSDLALAYAGYQGYNMAKHGLECAAWAIASEKLGKPLKVLMGGEKTGVPTGESFGIKPTVADLLGEIEERVAQGFCRIKVKIEPGWDVDVLREVVAAWPGLPVMADGNTGYDPGRAGPWRDLDELGLLMIEQPYPGDALIELAELQSGLRTPICLDEAATTPRLTFAALEMGAGRIVNIKPARLGGLTRSLAVHDHCLERGVPVWCGGLLETGIGRGFNLAISSLPGFTLPADMSPARLFYAEDLVDPTFEIRKDGTIPVPDLPGCGFPVDERRVRKYQSETWTSR